MGVGRIAASFAIAALLLARGAAAGAEPAPRAPDAPPLADPTPTAPAGAAVPAPSDAPGSPTAGVASGEPPPPVQYVDDALSVHVRQRALSEVIDEIARQAGATVKGSLKNPREVTAEFDKVPLADALNRLLGGDQNFALVYTEDGKLRTLRLLGSAGDAPRASGATRVPATPVAAGVQPPPANLAEVLAKGSPIAVSGRLAQVLGGSQAQFTDVLNAGLRNEDPSIRAEAVQTVVRTIESDPELRSAVMGTLQGMDDAQLATMIRGMAGDHGEEFLIQAAGHARQSDLRTKTQQVLQQLRLQPQPHPDS